MAEATPYMELDDEQSADTAGEGALDGDNVDGAGLMAANDDAARGEVVLSEAAVAVNTTYSDVREQVLGRVRSANELTEEKTLTIGQAVDDIVDVAKSQIEEIAGTVKTLEEKSNSGEEGAISRHTKAVSKYVDHVNVQLERQVRVAQVALEQSVEIVRAGAAIADLADAAKILALNARIESSRLHKKGSRFAVIATEMKTLSDGVDSANNLVRDLAERLQESLPTIAEQMRAMRQETRAFHKELQEHLKEIEDDKKGLQEALHASLKAGDRQLDKILKASQRALSELQFQDPMAQRLQRIDNDLAEAQKATAELLGNHVTDDDIPQGACTLVSDFVETEEEEMAEGELLLF